MDARIVTAIVEKRVLSLTYGSEQLDVEPHCYGLDFKGNAALLVWQRSFPKAGWKLLHLAKVRMLRPTSRKFDAARPGYTRGQVAMRQLYCQL